MLDGNYKKQFYTHAGKISVTLYGTLYGTVWLQKVQKEQNLISRRAFCKASDQSLDVLSYMTICKQNLWTIQLQFMSKSIWEKQI